MAEPPILFKLDDGVGVITLNRPDKLNALNLRMFALWKQALDECRAPTCRAVLIEAAGRSFCAGDDVSDGGFHDGLEVPAKVGYGHVSPSQYFTSPGPYWLWKEIRYFPKPVVCALHGHCAGAGAEVALACDLRVCADDLKLSFPYTKLGMVGGTWLLAKYVGLGMATELLLLARDIEAPEALQLGLVSRVVAKDELSASARELTRTLAAGPTKAYEYTKEALNRGLNADIQQGLEYMIWANGFARNADDQREGIAAFREKRPAKYSGQ